ncbi:MAG: hypothetical protein CM1200mP18_19830 [Gammaproteobacteria bacterium]|nr:MAG: hypothetical protein CM1200mP18_19830 [Gammaproteobacteria bacterium]
MQPGYVPRALETRYWEPFSVISFPGSKTSRLKFGPDCGLPMHNPFEIAKKVAK